MRAPRDGLRRRTHLMRQRSARVSHVQNTHSHYHVPEIGKKIASKANRAGGAARLDAPAVHKTMEVELALIPYEDERRQARELFSLPTATHHDPPTLYLLPTVPGSGKMLSLVVL